MTDSPPITPTWSDADLDQIIVAHSQQIKVYRESLVNQINFARSSQSPPKECLDLSDYVADISIETSVQGSSILAVQIIDPGWMLLRRDSAGVAFFDTDEDGFLWPPIDLNFPADVSDAQWSLCRLDASTDLTGPNITLTFEDKITSVLRQFQGPVQSNPNETRAEFIRRLVKEATIGGHLPPVTDATTGVTNSPVIGMPDGSIRFIALLPGVAFTRGDLTIDQTSPPASAKQPYVARQNPTKNPGPPAPKSPFVSPSSPQVLIAEGFSAQPINPFASRFVLPSTATELSAVFGVPKPGPGPIP